MSDWSPQSIRWTFTTLVNLTEVDRQPDSIEFNDTTGEVKFTWKLEDRGGSHDE